MTSQRTNGNFHWTDLLQRFQWIQGENMNTQQVHDTQQEIIAVLEAMTKTPWSILKEKARRIQVARAKEAERLAKAQADAKAAAEAKKADADAKSLEDLASKALDEDAKSMANPGESLDTL